VRYVGVGSASTKVDVCEVTSWFHRRTVRHSEEKQRTQAERSQEG
jgi:hypothetical protein